MINTKKMVLILALILTFALISGAGFRPWTDIQLQLHEAANDLRALGYAEDSAAIKALQEAWRLEDISNKQIQEKPWERFTREHPGYTCTEAGYYSLCEMLVHELGEAQRYGTYDTGTAILILKGAVNRCLYGDTFPNDIYSVIAQRGQYLSSYLVTSDNNYPEYIKNAVNLALLDDTILSADISPTGQDIVIPHSLFYHGNFLTGGQEFLRVNVVTSGGYTAVLVFGCDERHCTG